LLTVFEWITLPSATREDHLNLGTVIRANITGQLVTLDTIVELAFDIEIGFQSTEHGWLIGKI
jgi:hypothetical protein